MLHILGSPRSCSSAPSSSSLGSGAATAPGTAPPAAWWSSPVCSSRPSALWLTLLYAPQPGTGDLLYVLRLMFVAAMIASLVLGFTAIRRREVATHRAWMIRAYALGLAAGTQAFTEGFGQAILGTGVVAGDLAQAAGWAINLAVAEWVIRRPARIRRRRRQVARPIRPSATTLEARG